jgi:transcriptional regulator with XRE-family HTH domain
VQEGAAAKAARNMLNELMDERRWRIPQLADALGISVDIVRRWQQGKSRMQIDDLVAVARLKGADLNEVFGLKPSAVKSTSGNVEEIIDRKLEKVIGKIMVAMASAVNSENGNHAELSSTEELEEPRPRKRKS